MRLLITAAAVLLLVTGVGIAPALAQNTAAMSVPVTHSFRDWRVACDNGGLCTAYTGNKGHVTGFVLITMPAGPDAAPDITVGVDPGEDGTGPVPRINDSGVPIAWSSLAPEDGLGRVDGDGARALIAAMATARSMTLTGGEDDAPVSLSGLTQALSWVDRHQGRNQTPTALLLRGDRPETSVPPAPVLPLITAAPAVDQTGFGVGVPVPPSVDAMPQIRSCRRDWPESSRPDLALSARLDASTELWGPNCFLAASHIGHLLYLTGPGGRDPRPLTPAGALEPTVDFVNAEYDPATRTLSQYLWAGGTGSAGQVQHWVWTGTTFALQSERATRDLWNIPARLWPTLWRTRSSQVTDAPLADGVSAEDPSPHRAMASDTSAPVERNFEDWRVSCDNGAGCSAWSGRSDDAGGWVLITMAAGPDARPRIAAGSLNVDPSSSTGLRINDRAFTMTPSTQPDSGWVGTLEGAAARDAIDALAGARSTQVTGGDTPSDISLTGFTQALGWIDGHQGRDRTVTALLNRGDQPATTVPSPPPLPSVRGAAAIEQIGFGDGVAVPAAVQSMPDLIACRTDWGEMDRPAHSISARLDAATELWGAQCSMTTYNAGYLLYLTGPDGRDPQRLALAAALEGTDAFVNPAYDAGTRTLTQNLWGNKWGHCGRSQTWLWTGSAFRLQTERAMADCVGIPPPFWPTLWRSQ
ncbi:DUF1176 domain-containing protein [uncultured Brevundimonas sp.]|uniref:DUF1176 domain-containing protein n=1 Tax=uncultured Brevundimonas sp. TaxID=213418 RepID=UPI0030ECE672|tara:strand:+ start:127650 stop:129740 length:2091 start_codon:yes stop_codon:yes gene_type:complete